MTRAATANDATIASTEAIPTAIPVGILVGYVPAEPRPRRSAPPGRLAPPCSMILPVHEPVTTARQVTKAEAWWLAVDEIEPKAGPFDFQDSPRPKRRARAAEDRPSRWAVGMVWGLFGSLMMGGLLIGGWLVGQLATAPPSPRQKAPAAQIESIEQPVARGAAAAPIVQLPAATPAALPEQIEAAASLEQAAAVSRPSEPEPAPSQVVERPAEQPLAAGPQPPAARVEPAGQCALGEGRYGTSVDFAADPAEAARRALRDKKLLFLLNISGNFEDDNFT